MTRQPSSPNASCLNAKALILAQVDQSLDLSVDFSLSDFSFSALSCSDLEESAPEGAAFIDAQQPATSFLQADSALPGESSPAWLAAHVLGCTDCRTYQTTMTHLTESVSDLDEVPLPAGLADRIMDRILADGGFVHGEGQDSQTLLPFPNLRDATASLSADSASPSTSGEEVLMPSSKVGSAGAGFRWKKSAPIAAAALLLVLGLPSLYQTVYQTLNQTSHPSTAQAISSENAPQDAQPSLLDVKSRELARRQINQAASVSKNAVSRESQSGLDTAGQLIASQQQQSTSPPSRLASAHSAEDLARDGRIVALKPGATSHASVSAFAPVSLTKAVEPERGAATRNRQNASELRAGGNSNSTDSDAFDSIDGQELAYDPMLDDPFLASAEWIVREESTTSISQTPQRTVKTTSSARTLATARPGSAANASILPETDAELDDDPLSTMMGF